MCLCVYSPVDSVGVEEQEKERRRQVVEKFQKAPFEEIAAHCGARVSLLIVFFLLFHENLCHCCLLPHWSAQYCNLGLIFVLLFPPRLQCCRVNLIKSLKSRSGRLQHGSFQTSAVSGKDVCGDKTSYLFALSCSQASSQSIWNHHIKLRPNPESLCPRLWDEVPGLVRVLVQLNSGFRNLQ